MQAAHYQVDLARRRSERVTEKTPEQTKLISDALNGNERLHQMMDLNEDDVSGLTTAAYKKEVSGGLSCVTRSQGGLCSARCDARVIPCPVKT